MIEQQVALDVVVVRGAGEVEVTLQPQLVACGRRLTAVVRLHAGTPDEAIGVLLKGRAEEELVVPGLVAPHDHAGAVVALDEDTRAIQPRGKALNFFKRRGQVCQRHPRQLRGRLTQLIDG